MKLEVTKEQLELLEFMIQEFEYQDEEERALIEGIEAQIYDVKEEDLLRVMNILKAQAKQPQACLLYTSPSPRDSNLSRMPSSA